MASTVAKIGGSEEVVQAQDLIRGALGLAEKYRGPDRQQLVDALNQALQQQLH
jgi:hypothetical protein